MGLWGPAWCAHTHKPTGLRYNYRPFHYTRFVKKDQWVVWAPLIACTFSAGGQIPRRFVRIGFISIQYILAKSKNQTSSIASLYSMEFLDQVANATAFSTDV